MKTRLLLAALLGSFIIAFSILLFMINWYRSKRHPAFSDMLVELRRQSVGQEVLRSAVHRHRYKNPLTKLLPTLGITP